MLSYALAIAVAISSLILFSTAFLMSKIHRQDDFLWGAVGLFYALILWYCARNITGTVLLGQAAASILVVSYGWQIIKLRREIINPTQADETNGFSVVGRINNLRQRKKPPVQSAATPMTKASIPKVTEENIAIPETPTEISEPPVEQAQKTVEQAAEKLTSQATTGIAKKIADVQDNADDHDQQVSKPVATEPLPLPNKLPEVVQVDESEIAQDNNQNEAGQKTPENISTASQTVSKTILDKTSVEETNPNLEKVPEESVKSPQPKSALDSLETVEVAEVLEADRLSNNREADRYNVIEVTTTEVKVTKEVIKPDQNQDSDDDWEDFT